MVVSYRVGVGNQTQLDEQRVFLTTKPSSPALSYNLLYFSSLSEKVKERGGWEERGAHRIKGGDDRTTWGRSFLSPNSALTTERTLL